MTAKKDQNGPIDIFLTWVDGADEEWLKSKRACEKEIGRAEVQEEHRFQSWDNLKYLFRAIEACMPWVNRIFLVTCGQVPSFLNLDNPRLVLLSHKDYIPNEYLPTFNSNVIELNLHRIEELSDNFILFNDDCIPLMPISEEYYFKKNMVCDEAIERIIAPKDAGDPNVFYRFVNIMRIINRRFDKREVQKKNWKKWFFFGYGKKMFQNIVMHYFHDFDFLVKSHEPQALKKSIFQEVWDIEPEALRATCENQFRNYTDVSWYLMRLWLICKGDFCPRKSKSKFYNIDDKNYMKIADEIRAKKYQMIILNERNNLKKWESIKDTINGVLEEIFPCKSSFEK